MKYFGIDAYINTRYKTDSGYPFYPGTNFGDPVNLRTINTTDPDQTGVPFSKPVVVVHTADAAAAKAVPL